MTETKSYNVYEKYPDNTIKQIGCENLTRDELSKFLRRPSMQNLDLIVIGSQELSDIQLKSIKFAI